MKKLAKLLALALAVVMLLPAAALAADNSANGPKLVVCGLNWDEGHFANDDDISGRNYGGEEAYITPGDEWAVIFFLIGTDGKRTPVIPKAGEGVTIRKLEKDEIASGAKQSQYYVCIRMDDWSEAEITSGKAAMKVFAELPDVGLYTTAEAAQKSYLRNDQQPYDPSQLPGKTVYLVRNVTDDANQRQITDVKKNSHGNSNMYDLEKVSDNVWKITLKIGDEGGMGVNLDIAFKEQDGRTYTEERGWGFEYPHGPELWMQWLSWEEDPKDIEPQSEIHYNTPVFTPYDELHIAFYTCEDGGNKLTPVPVDQLKATGGLTIEPLVPGVRGKEAYANISGFEWNKDYTVSCGEYTMTIKCDLPDLGVYSKPELTTDAFLANWKFTPFNPNETVYVGVNIPENDDRVLADLKLAKFENSDQFTLEKYNDQFYKLTRKTINIPDGGVEFEITWKWPDGNTDTQTNSIVWLESILSAVISEKPLADSLEARVFYENVKDIASNSITLKAGESKTVYLGHTYYYFRDGSGGWRVASAVPEMYAASDGLKLEAASGSGYPIKYTLTGNTPGEYLIGVCDGYEWFAYDKDGKEIADSLAEKDIYPDYDFETGEWSLFDYSKDEPVPYEFDGKIETKPNEMNSYWYPIQVTVTGDASTAPDAPAGTAFSDVKAKDWFAPAVAFANGKGYMNGNPDGTFAPSGKVTGAQFAQILYNKDGKPAAAEGAAFQGVDKQWYAPAILWAAGKGIVTDTGDAAVAPEKDLTREQIAAMLHNYMGKPEAKGDLTVFTDAAKVSGWAKGAMAWAVGAGVLKGSGGALNPTGTATRAETAQILMNFFK